MCECEVRYEALLVTSWYIVRDLKINTFLQQMYKCVLGFLTLSLIKAQKCAENDMRITVTNYKEQEEPKFSYSKS